MNDNEYLAGVIAGSLEKQVPVVLVSIVSQDGSSPRHTGTQMVVDAAGHAYGTVGGSLVEATAIRESRVAVQVRSSRFMHFSMSGADASAPGMICGGQTTLLLEYIPPSQANLDFFHLLRDSLQTDRDFFHLTHFAESDGTVNILGQTLLDKAGQVVGGLPLDPVAADLLQGELHNISATAVVDFPGHKAVVAPIRRVKTLYLFGAGHVALPTARLAARVGFRVVVVDDRPEYASADRFPEADRWCVIADFNQALAGLEIDADSFIVIVTRGHKFDREVLEQSLRTSAGYIGMISSRRKKAAVYAALLAQGVSQAALDRVHSPIGLEIGAETPEEIAVSIVAELISVRHNPRP